MDSNPRSTVRRYSLLVGSAKARGIVCELTEADYETLSMQPCFYCGQDLPENTGYRIDRADSAIGYTLANSRACCTTCNLAKSILTEGEFARWIVIVYEHWAKEHAVNS